MLKKVKLWESFIFKEFEKKSRLWPLFIDKTLIFFIGICLIIFVKDTYAIPVNTCNLGVKIKHCDIHFGLQLLFCFFCCLYATSTLLYWCQVFTISRHFYYRVKEGCFERKKKLSLQGKFWFPLWFTFVKTFLNIEIYYRYIQFIAQSHIIEQV